MYDVYLDKILLPVTPEKIGLSVKNQNKTVNLMSGVEVNILNVAGLSELSFTALIPQSEYPFAHYKDGFLEASFFLDRLESLKTARDKQGRGQPFQFIVSRSMPDGTVLFDSNLTVSLEDYTVTEDAKQGFDLLVAVKLKQFRPYGTKKVKVTPPKENKKDPPKGSAKQDRPAQKPPPIGVGSNVIVNGRLHRDSYGKGPGQTRTNYRGKVNFINKKGTHPYHITTPSGGWQGWVLASAVRAV